MNTRLTTKLRQGAYRRVHFQGDSITQGSGFLSQQQNYVAYLAAKFRELTPDRQPVELYNHAVGGATSADGVQRSHWCDREGHQAHITFVMFGLNDVHQDIAIEAYASNLTTMISRIKDFGSDVVLLGPTPFVGRENEIEQFSGRARQVAGKLEVAFVDCLSPFYEDGEVPPGLLWPDGIHLTAEGQEKLGKLIWQRLQEMEDSEQGN